MDLADERAFVVGITELDALPKEKFKTLEKVEYAIATGQRSNRGLATIAAVLGYAGKSFTSLIDGKMQFVHGWLGLTWRRF